MTASEIFKIVNPLAAFCWIVLVVFPRWKYVRVITVTGMSSLVFAGIYAFSLAAGMRSGAEGDFQSLEGVAKLFENPYALLAGWVHYLAFDLFVGSWISADALKNRISRWIVLPAQFFTFMFGPIGLAMYLAIRAVFARQTILNDPFGA